jgi:hypothetical protein
MMRVIESAESIFGDEKIGDTINVTPDIKCRDLGYNSTDDEYSFHQRKARLLFPAKQQSDVPKSTYKWMVGSQTDVVIPWYVIFPRICPRFFGSQTDTIRPDIPLATVNNFTEISPEIKEMSNNVWFDKVLTTALSEISFLLNKEIYQIKVKVEEDLEIPEWKETLILIRVPKRNPKDLIRLWKVVEERVRKKIDSIREENEEITKINENLAIFIEELD